MCTGLKHSMEISVNERINSVNTFACSSVFFRFYPKDCPYSHSICYSSEHFFCKHDKLFTLR